MIFTDLPREELLQAIARGDNRLSATELLHAEASAGGGGGKGGRPDAAIHGKGAAAYRQLQRKAAELGQGTVQAKGDGRMTISSQAMVVSIRRVRGHGRPHRKRGQPRKRRTTRRCSLPSMIRIRRRASLDSEVSRLVLVMGKDGFRIGRKRLYRFRNTCISASGNSASPPTGRCSASSSPTFSRSWSRCMAATCCGYSTISACAGCRGYARRIGISGQCGGDGGHGADYHRHRGGGLEAEAGTGGKAWRKFLSCMMRDASGGGQSSPCSGSSASSSSPQSPQIRLASGFAQAFMPHTGQVYLVLLAAFFLRVALALACPVVVEERGAGGQEGGAGLLEASARLDGVRHLLAGVLAAGLAGVWLGSGRSPASWPPIPCCGSRSATACRNGAARDAPFHAPASKACSSVVRLAKWAGFRAISSVTSCGLAVLAKRSPEK